MKHKRHHETFKDISLPTAILTLIFMALVAVYQMGASEHDLGDELNRSFAAYKK